MALPEVFIPITAWKAARVLESTGSMQDAATAAKVDVQTVESWQKSEWWDVVLSDTRSQLADEMRGQYTGIVGLALRRMKERLEEGDEELTRSGDVVNVAVSAKDCAIIAGISSEKRALLGGESTRNVSVRHVHELKSELRTLSVLPDAVVHEAETLKAPR